MGSGKIGLKSDTSVLCFCMLLTLGSVALGKTIYVDADANGANNGTSWADAYEYLQDALANAVASEKPVEIRVAQGIYKPDQGGGNLPGERGATFSLENGVSIKGGYAGLSQADPNARDIQKYETILSGDLNNDDAGDMNDPSRNENSYHVIYAIAIDETSVLDGFTVTGGNANHFDPCSTDDQGGGIIVWQGSPTFLNCTFYRNGAPYKGGAMFCHYDSNPTLINCTFTGNWAGFRGGAAEFSSSKGTLTDCVFINNSSDWSGGGINNVRSNPTLNNCTFTGNSATGCGGAMMNEGGSSPTLVNCTFTMNTVPNGSGGAIFNSASNPILNHCRFDRNRAQGGGAIYNSDSSPTIASCIFIGNSALEGGAMRNLSVYDDTCSPAITKCIFSGNSARSRSGAIYGSQNSLILVNCTFEGNKAGDLSFGSAVVHHDEGTVTITNCIIRNGPGETSLLVTGDIPPVVTYSNLQGSWLGEGNIDVDPCYAKSGYWDPNDTPEDANDDFWINGDYHLKSQAGRWDPNTQTWIKDDVTSLCIDAGDPMSPIRFEPFPNGGRINMGAYGGTAEASKSYFGGQVCETIVAGDINGDCQIDWADFVILAFHWMEDNTSVNSNSVARANKSYFDEPVCETVIAGDINSDCKVDFRDFSLTAAHWLEDHREKLHVQWLGHASVKIWTSTVVIYVDPYKLTTSPKDATLLLITHSHSDHYSTADISRVSGPATQLFGPASVINAAGKGTVILPGQTIDLGSVRITGVAAYNSNHPKSNNWLGFIVDILGKKIFCAGDTSLTTELKAVVGMDVAFLPIDGVYNMGPAVAAEATIYMQPKLAIPYHWGSADPQTFAKLAACPVKIMTVGEEIVF